MPEIIKRYREIAALLIYGLIFIFLSALFVQGNFPESTILNFRPGASKELIPDLLSSVQNMELGKKKDIKGDDPGFMILYTLVSVVEGNHNPSTSNEAKDFSTTFHVLQIFIHLFFVALFLMVPALLLNFRTKIIMLFFLLSPNLLAVFWGFDVYLFPLYASFVSLYCLGNLKQGSLTKSKFFLCSILVVVCEIFRKNSLFFFLPVLGLIAFKKDLSKKTKGIFLGTFVMSFIVIKLLVSVGFNTKGHTVWHSLHAGLFELGGCVDKKGESYPFFIYDIDNIKRADMAYCSPKWNDVFEYVVAGQHGIKDYFSPAYEELLKKQTIEIVSGHPSEMISFLLMRFLNILNLSPFKSHTRLGSVSGNQLEGLIVSMLFLLVYMLWFIKEKDREKKYLYTVMLLLAMAPPLLVHSGHLIYNMGVNFFQWLIIVAAAEKLIIRQLFSSDQGHQE